MQRLARDREHDRDQLDDEHDREHRPRGAEIRQEERLGAPDALRRARCRC
jgi:hypothetical protein